MRARAATGAHLLLFPSSTRKGLGVRSLAREEPHPAFGHPPLRGEGPGEPSGDKAGMSLAPLSS
jgi:hypothetical protein